MIGYVAGTGWPTPEGVISVKRKHVHEGYNGAEHIQELYDQGVRRVILTASVGGLTVDPGTIARVRSFITLFCPSPVKEFVDMSGWTPLDDGVTHAFVPGPNFETLADVIALKALGADVVGMSLAPEVIMASHLGMGVTALVYVTNLSGYPHSHARTIESAEEARSRLLKEVEKHL